MSIAPDENLAEVFRLLRERAGMEPESVGCGGIESVVRRRISASGADSPQTYARRLSTDTAEFSELLEELLVPETWCFRDPLAFRHLSRFLDAWRSENRGTIRLLSVGCSTGEEVYSLAMALREAGFRPTQFFILGTDLSRRSLEVARKGGALAAVVPRARGIDRRPARSMV